MAEMKKDREFKNEYDYHKYWKDMYEKEHKLRQEAEGETTIVKGIGQNSPEMRKAVAQIKELQDSLDRFKKDNNDLYNRIADALEINESHHKSNGKLQEKLTELEEDNKKLAQQIDDKINQMRRSGM